jgi:anti-sigma factor RsiW
LHSPRKGSSKEGAQLTNGEHIRDEELELYALGGLPDEEAAAFKSHLAGCGECAMKLAQSRGSAALLSFTAKQEQPAGTIKAALMARVRANRDREEHYAWPLRTTEPAAEKTGRQRDA